MNLGAIVTTYNSPRWLEKVLFGYENQSDMGFTVIVADDGSGKETKAVINNFKFRGKLNIVHEWQEDDGFQKTRILNQCVRNTQCDYLIFTDGDCVPRYDYIEQHKRLARKGYFVSGGLYRLNMGVSIALDEFSIKDRSVFSFVQLQKLGQKSDFKRHKLSKSRLITSVLNKLTPTKATWNGGNTGCWRQDVVDVNGFDERMQYGGLDRELGERMMNVGVKGIQARYSVITLHLDHSRGYENKSSWDKNKQIRKAVKQGNRVWTDYGLIKTSIFN